MKKKGWLIRFECDDELYRELKVMTHERRIPIATMTRQLLVAEVAAWKAATRKAEPKTMGRPKVGWFVFERMDGTGRVRGKFSEESEAKAVALASGCQYATREEYYNLLEKAAEARRNRQAGHGRRGAVEAPGTIVDA